MDKLIQALITELKIALATDETAMATIGDIEKETALYSTLSESDASRKKHEHLAILARLKSGQEQETESPDSETIETFAAIYDIFTAVNDAANQEEGHGAASRMKSLLSNLMWCSEDLDSAIAVVQEIILLVELQQKESELNAIKENQAAEKDAEAAKSQALYKLYKKMGIKDEDIPKAIAGGKVESEEEGTIMTDKLIQLAQLLATSDEAAQYREELAALNEKDTLTDEEKARLNEIVDELQALAEKEGAEETNTADAEKTPEMVDPKPEGDAKAEEQIADDTQTETVQETETPAEEGNSEVTTLKEQVAELTAQLAAYAAKEKATARLAILKEKGLDVVFATEEERKAETERLMGMTDEEFDIHVKLLEQAKAAFAKQEATASENETGEPAPQAGVIAAAQANLEGIDFNSLWE